MAQWVDEYLGARISLREIIEDIGVAGASHNPAYLLEKVNERCGG